MARSNTKSTAQTTDRTRGVVINITTPEERVRRSIYPRASLDNAILEMLQKVQKKAPRATYNDIICEILSQALLGKASGK